MTCVLPVIHHLSVEHVLDEVALATEAGVDGVFLIDHHGRDTALLQALEAVVSRYPALYVGVNLLSVRDPLLALSLARAHGADALWLDHAGVSSTELEGGRALAVAVGAGPRIEVYASVAFKYQPVEPNPAGAAANAHDFGFIATTSGERTGQPPSLEKVGFMAAATQGRLAVASGLTPENMAAYAPLVSHALVATGVQAAPAQLDYERLCRFVGVARNLGA